MRGFRAQLAKGIQGRPMRCDIDQRAIVVLAQGMQKAAVVARALEGPPTAGVPASWLQGHAAVTWLLDEASAARLARR